MTKPHLWTRWRNGGRLTLVLDRGAREDAPTSAVSPAERRAAAKARLIADRRRGVETPRWIVDIAAHDTDEELASRHERPGAQWDDDRAEQADSSIAARTSDTLS